jgi:hypothetical protein
MKSIWFVVALAAATITGCSDTHVLTKANAPVYAPCGVPARLVCDSDGNMCTYILPPDFTPPCGKIGMARYGSR